MNELENKEQINVPLVIISFLFALLVTSLPNRARTLDLEGWIGLYIGSLILSPLMVLWFKALWNNIIPAIFNLRKITFWEAFGLLTLITLIVI